MRFLSIERKRSPAACLSTVKVYIEDPVEGEREIDGVRCRQLGTLRNGEKANFRISEAAARVFVICGLGGKDGRGDCYCVPAGSANIALSGQRIMKPAAGNPFRFKGDETLQDLKLRRKLLMMGAILVAILTAAALIIGAVQDSKVSVGNDRMFVVDDMTITLTTDFVEADAQGYARAMNSQFVTILVLQEEFTLLEGLADYTLEQYGELVLGNNTNTDNEGLQVENGVTYFEYDKVNREDGKTYRYIVTMYKGTDAFWLIQYVLHENDVNKYKPYIFDWAATVTFAK